MKLGQFEAFLRVASRGSYGKAAASLGLTQPSISTRIAGLESSVGAALFVRKGNRMVLTSAGRQLMPVAEEIVRLARTAAMISAGETERVEVLRVGTNESSAVEIVPRVLSVYGRAFPRVRVEARVEATRDLVPMLAEGTLEVAFVNPSLADIRVQALWTYSRKTVLASAASNPHVGASLTYPDELSALTFVSYTVGPAQDAMNRLQHTVGDVLRIGMSTNSTGIALRAIRDGLFVGFLPRDAVADAFQAGEMGEIHLGFLDLPPWDVSLVKWGDRSLSGPVESLLRLLERQGAAVLAAIGGHGSSPE